MDREDHIQSTLRDLRIDHNRLQRRGPDAECQQKYLQEREEKKEEKRKVLKFLKKIHIFGHDNYGR